jgi:hypothetical protein
MGRSCLRFHSRPAQLVASFGVLGCLLANSASGAIVPLIPGALAQGAPDATVDMISVNYDADNGLLHVGIAAGGLITIDQDGVRPTPDHVIFTSTFDVTAMIGGAGFASSGTLSLSGNYDSPGGLAVSLQSNTLTGFGHDPATRIFTFLFDDSVSTVPGFGPVVGIVLAANFPVSSPSGLGSDFSNVGPVGGLGIADVFTPIPEPSSMIAWSIGSALAGLVGWRRARNRRRAI